MDGSFAFWSRHEDTRMYGGVEPSGDQISHSLSLNEFLGLHVLCKPLLVLLTVHWGKNIRKSQRSLGLHRAVGRDLPRRLMSCGERKALLWKEAFLGDGVHVPSSYYEKSLLTS